MGFKEEAESFAEITCTKGWQVLSIDLPEHGERKQEKDRFNPWFVAGSEFERCLFVSPVLDILYAGNDNMTTRETVDGFAEQFHSSLMVMENGEHWFHTPEQLAVLNQWVTERV